ncbi:MAG: DNA-processing protein DprA [Desulfovibrio sp.]|jgi:DNA processing protein|nr:DNA-processing protein DprA [Desulfovibrio sp.]
MIFSELTLAERNELWALLALRHAWGLGPTGAGRIIAAYGGAYAAVEAGLARSAEWAEKGLVHLPVARAFAGGGWRDKAGVEWHGIKSMGLSFIVQSDPAYPQLLREPAGAPLLLYFKGDISLLRGPAVGIVGARNCTSEGLAVSAFFARDLARAGVTVISGMARGIDRAAHLAGLEGPGRSIGVLGTGIDVMYPARNTDLYARMEKDGLLISEFAPGTGPVGKNFPIRNRLISATALGILVVEAAGRSGSLITARLALEHNREVFAVPGSAMSPMSEGCRELIRKGAKAAFNAEDILLELAPLLQANNRAPVSPAVRTADAPDAHHAAPAAGTVPLRTEQTAPATPSAGSSTPSDVAPGAGTAPLRTEPATPAGSSKAAPPNPTGTALHPDAPPARRQRRSSSAHDILPRKKKQGHRQDESGSTGSREHFPLPKAGERGKVDSGFAGRRSGVPPKAEISEDSDGADEFHGEEGRVLAAVGVVPRHIDEIAHALTMDAGSLSAALTVLEMRGLVRRLPGMLYSLPEV